MRTDVSVEILHQGAHRDTMQNLAAVDTSLYTHRIPHNEYTRLYIWFVSRSYRGPTSPGISYVGMQTGH